jgi:hypothetical protein
MIEKVFVLALQRELAQFGVWLTLVALKAVQYRNMLIHILFYKIYMNASTVFERYVEP